MGLEVVTTATYTKALFHVEAIIYSTAREFHKQCYWKKYFHDIYIYSCMPSLRMKKKVLGFGGSVDPF